MVNNQKPSFRLFLLVFAVCSFSSSVHVSLLSLCINIHILTIFSPKYVRIRSFHWLCPSLYFIRLTHFFSHSFSAVFHLSESSPITAAWTTSTVSGTQAPLCPAGTTMTSARPAAPWADVAASDRLVLTAEIFKNFILTTYSKVKGEMRLFSKRLSLRRRGAITTTEKNGNSYSSLFNLFSENPRISLVSKPVGGRANTNK